MAQVSKDPFSGAVLAGGRSKRFGSNKAMANYQGQPLLCHVLQSLTQAHERFVIANQPISSVNVPIYPDLIKTRSPMSGLHSALTYAIHSWVAVAACDLPNLNTTYWRFLYNAKGDSQAVVIRHENGKLEPLAALYHRTALPIIETRLRTNQFSLHALMADLNTTYVASQPFASDGLFKNINKPEDL